jgi:hypothetical protein
MKKIFISIAGVLMIAVVLVLFINARKADKSACCPEAATTEVVKENDKAACPGMTGCQQTCHDATPASE